MVHLERSLFDFNFEGVVGLDGVILENLDTHKFVAIKAHVACAVLSFAHFFEQLKLVDSPTNVNSLYHK